MEYPFAAIICQPRLLLALKLLAVCPQLGGLLISGEKGTAKSTAARSLSTVLDSPYVNMPLGITEDRLLGTIDIEQLLESKTHSFSPGLMSKANGGILYVDEINLLPDRLVDVLLDASVSGVNYVERDGISHQHEAKFMLVGTMNKDEGELRPQLRDRFGLSLVVKAPTTPESRVEIVRERMSFQADKQAFIERYKDKQLSIKEHLATAKSILSEVVIPDNWQLYIAQNCIEENVEGLRADLTWYMASQAHAALHNRLIVEEQDVSAVKDLVLDHRRKEKTQNNQPPPPSSRKIFQRPPEKDSSENRQSQQLQQQMTGIQDSDNNPKPSNTQGSWGGIDAENILRMNNLSLDDHVNDIFRVIFKTKAHLSTQKRSHSTNHTKFKKNSYQKPLEFVGRSSKRSLQQKGFPGPINWHQSILKDIDFNELVFHHFEPPNPHHNLIILDTSASSVTKVSQSFSRQVLCLISQLSYLYRQKLAVLSFGQSSVQWLMTLQKPYKMISDFLPHIPFGGGTPLVEALGVAREFIRTHGSFRTFLVTDGRVNFKCAFQPWPQDMWVVDTESSKIPLGRSKTLAEQLGATYIKL